MIRRCASIQSVIFLTVLALSFSFARIAGAQSTGSSSPQNVYAAGVSWNQSATPAVAGTALYAHAVSSSGTYAFTVIDALPTSEKPFTVTTNVGAGIAQKVFTLGKVPVFVPTTAGISWTGKNTGWQWSTGALFDIKLRKKSNWRLFPMVRFLKSNVSNNSDYQGIVGVIIGWGK